jgi:regulator of protease activity HflC (stomatin/prohibitin superfamily)
MSQSTKRLTLAVCLGVALVPAYGFFEWTFCRVEPANNRVVVVIKKTGPDLPQEKVIATGGEKGIQLEVLKPGARYFLNPFFYDWEEKPIFEVPQGKVGILVRKFGSDPSPEAFANGSFVVKESSQEKGIIEEVLQPGAHALNPYAYDLLVAEAHEVPMGFVGIQTRLVGPQPKDPDKYVSAPGERGIQPDTLKPGSYYVNPYVTRIDNFDVRTKRLELSKAENDKLEGAVSFYSADGFEIEVHLTTTWQIDEKRAPEVFARASTESDSSKLEEEIITKVLHPAIRGIARIEGSKFPTIEYIGGTSRHVFQNKILEELKNVCSPFGVIIHEVLVNDITPPKEISEPIREREIAKEELARNLNQIKQAVAEQALARTSALQAQAQAQVAAETARIQQTTAAQALQDVAVIDQDRLLTVAKTDLVSAKAQAEATLARGQAEADVIVANNAAEAEPIRESVSAFKSGADFAAYSFALRVGAAIHGVFADPDGPFGKLFIEALGKHAEGQAQPPLQPSTKEGGR